MPVSTPVRSAVWLSLCALGFGAVGTVLAQEKQRSRADSAVEQLLEDKTWNPGETSVEGTDKSRFHDPNDPNEPPAPKDDPESFELMRRVDGMRGSKRWEEAGEGIEIESDRWREFLPLDDEGRVTLSLENAVLLALLHSRTYQGARETLYLSALDVTGQRFRFDTRFSLTNTTTETALGGKRGSGNALSSTTGSSGAAPVARNSNSRTTVESQTDLQINHRTATGADLVVGLANSILFDISGGSDTVVSSVVNFGVVQPLLRFGARDFVLEELTQSERSLLADVRRMKQFQQGFYIDTVSGRSIAEGPSRGAGGGGAPQIAGGATGADGFLGLLQDRQQIRNQESSVAALRDSLAQLQAAFDAGRINNRLQVDQARQALYNGQSALLNAYAGFDTTLDSYKVSLGLPPDLEIKVEDVLMDRFNLVDPSVSELQSRVAAILGDVRRTDRIQDAEDLATRLDRLMALSPRIDHQLERARADLEAFRQQLPARRTQLEALKHRPEMTNVHMDPDLFDPAILEVGVARLDVSLKQLDTALGDTRRNLSALRETEPPPALLDRARKSAVGEMTALSSQLLELSLIQAAARLESVTLNPIELDFDTAYALAESNRLDWMNARASLVDSWRQVSLGQEALKTGLNLIVNGDVPTVGKDAFSFAKGGGRVQLGFALDTPLSKLEEGNAYRETLISYQRARRNYMLFEDQAQQSLRNTLRTVRLSQLNFEVRRAAVRVAISQVDLARLRLNEPPKPGVGGAQFGATTARDLVDALRDLLSAQNAFLNVWVGFETLRMSLDYELGLMQLDQRGLWVDPGPISGDQLKGRIQERRQPQPEPEKLPVADVEAGEEPDESKKPTERKGIFAIFRKKEESPEE